jgi:hypothetical protein
MIKLNLNLKYYFNEELTAHENTASFKNVCESTETPIQLSIVYTP